MTVRLSGQQAAYCAAVDLLAAAERSGDHDGSALACMRCDTLWVALGGYRPATGRTTEYARGYSAGYYAGKRDRLQG